MTMDALGLGWGGQEEVPACDLSASESGDARLRPRGGGAGSV